MKATVSKLGDAVDVLSGFAYQAELFNEAEGMPLIRIRDVVRGFSNTRYSGEVDARFVVQNGEILIGMDGNFNTARWTGGPALLNQRVCKVTARAGILDEGFLFHLLPNELKKIEDATAFVTVKHLSVKGIRDIDIALPPLPEQRRIAAVLDQADALRAKRREALAQLDCLTQSIFIEMFGDPVTNTNNWQPVQLADVSDIVTGFAFKSEEYVDDSDSSIKLCRGANVMPGRLDWSDLASWPASRSEQVVSFKLQVGDIVMAMDRPWISEGFKVAQITKNDCPSLLVQRVARLRGAGGVKNDYLYHLLNHPAFTAHCRPTETTIPHISPREIRSFRFHLPPANLQDDFVNRVSCLNHLKSWQIESLKELDSLFASLQHRAFQGDL